MDEREIEMPFRERAAGERGRKSPTPGGAPPRNEEIGNLGSIHRVCAKGGGRTASGQHPKNGIQRWASLEEEPLIMPLQRGPPPPLLPANESLVPPTDNNRQSPSNLDSSISIPFQGLHIDEDTNPRHPEVGVHSEDNTPGQDTMDEKILRERDVRKEQERRNENNPIGECSSLVEQ